MDNPDTVAACPECDHAGQRSPYEREDGTWRCYACGATVDEPRWRANRRGENLDAADRRRGAANGPTPSDEFMRRIAQLPRGPRRTDKLHERNRISTVR